MIRIKLAVIFGAFFGTIYNFLPRQGTGAVERTQAGNLAAASRQKRIGEVKALATSSKHRRRRMLAAAQQTRRSMRSILIASPSSFRLEKRRKQEVG